jgi:hypothetical protein
MTPKQIRDAVIELRDMAYEHERRAANMDGESFDRGRRADRARMLRDVATMLERSLSL